MSLANQRLLVLASVALLSLVGTPWPKSRAGGPSDALIIVSGRSFPGTNVAYADLKSAFRGQRVLVSGQVLIPIHHPRDSGHRIAFDRIVLGLGPEAVGRFWVDMRIRDQAQPPATVSSPQLALRIAAVVQGAISYTPEIAVLPTHKVLTVDGKKATDFDYPVRQ